MRQPTITLRLRRALLNGTPVEKMDDALLHFAAGWWLGNYKQQGYRGRINLKYHNEAMAQILYRRMAKS